jgi:hypothetical protein
MLGIKDLFGLKVALPLYLMCTLTLTMVLFIQLALGLLKLYVF